MKIIWEPPNNHSRDLPSGKRLHNYGKIHRFQWENPLFLWSFSIANCNKLPEGTKKHPHDPNYPHHFYPPDENGNFMGTATWAMKNTPIPSHYNTSWLVNTSIMAQLSFIHDIPIVLMVWTPSDLHNGWLLFNPSTEVFFMAHFDLRAVPGTACAPASSSPRDLFACGAPNSLNHAETNHIE